MALYRCRMEEVPLVEGALAAHGFVVVASWAQEVAGRSSVVLTQPGVQVLLQADAVQAEGRVHVWGVNTEVALGVLHTLPIVFRQDEHANADDGGIR